jgi:hypothetical protein
MARNEIKVVTIPTLTPKWQYSGADCPFWVSKTQKILKNFEKLLDALPFKL